MAYSGQKQVLFGQKHLIFGQQSFFFSFQTLATCMTCITRYVVIEEDFFFAHGQKRCMCPAHPPPPPPADKIYGQRKTSAPPPPTKLVPYGYGRGAGVLQHPRKENQWVRIRCIKKALNLWRKGMHAVIYMWASVQHPTAEHYATGHHPL